MKFVAFERAKQGTGASRRLRITGRTPGIVYGGAAEPQLIELDHNALWHALKKEAFHSSVLDMELNGAENKVLLRDVQMHPFRNEILPKIIEQKERERKIQIWSAASSSGQEPYSLAILIREHFPQLASWQVQILATDLSNEMVEKTTKGEYSQLEVNRGLPAPLLAKLAAEGKTFS